ncbi:MAG TPA: MFS transporter [Candidatus Binataceae bacterium]|jgi:predicted MFS family arabinose efflux permease|nr:MFS transporter [Candidatus Binataceae bacterium]
MAREERKGWLLLGVLFLSNFFVIGSTSSITGVFLTPLVRHFGWTRTRAASLTMLLALTGALAGPILGRLLDSLAVQKVMAAGVALTAIALLAAGQANSFAAMAAAHVMIGIGTAASTIIPVSLVTSNWFGARRGVALGVAMSGMSLGASAMASFASYLIAVVGWRDAYTILAIPLLVLVIPIVLLIVRTRPPMPTGDRTTSQPLVLAEGLDRSEALRGRSFWLIGITYFMYLMGVGLGVVHFVPYLIGLGMSAQRAAAVFSVALLASTLSKPVMGIVADRVKAPVALAMAVLSLSGAFLLLTQAAHALVLVPLVIFYGIGVGAPVALVPMLMAECFGLKTFGTLAGLMGIFGMLGTATGPMFAGRIFDVSGAYTTAFILMSLFLMIAALLPFGCLPFRIRARAAAPALAQQALT